MQRFGLGATSQTVAANDVEEVLVGHKHKAKGTSGLPFTTHNPITLISDSYTVTFGETLDETEAKYISALVTAVLSAPS